MKTKLTLKPGQNGTRKWVEKYGERLVNVRYRNDQEQRKRYITVEIIVAAYPWDRHGSDHAPFRKPADRIGIRVAGYETDIREKVKKAGGIWRPRQQLWELPYAQIKRLQLEDRIVEGFEKPISQP